jgi:hypothetical protein
LPCGWLSGSGTKTAGFGEYALRTFLEWYQTRKHLTKATKLSRNAFLSPFRYPGGKSWFVKTACRWLEHQKLGPKILVEPYAGGAGISLTAVHEKFVNQAALRFVTV